VWIGVLVTVIITLVGGYIVIWTSTPIAKKYRKWRDDRAQAKAMKSVKNAKKRIETLEQDLKILSLYIQYPVILSAYTFRNYAWMALYFANALFVGFAYFIDYGVNPISNKWIILQEILVLLVQYNLLMVALSAFKMVTLMDKIAYFLTYEEKISKQIADLQEVIKSMEQKALETQAKG